jgi:hypothetical protein
MEVDRFEPFFDIAKQINLQFVLTLLVRRRQPLHVHRPPAS